MHEFPQLSVMYFCLTEYRPARPECVEVFIVSEDHPESLLFVFVSLNKGDGSRRGSGPVLVGPPRFVNLLLVRQLSLGQFSCTLALVQLQLVVRHNPNLLVRQLTRQHFIRSQVICHIRWGLGQLRKGWCQVVVGAIVDLG
jgi:hypothetical protein